MNAAFTSRPLDIGSPTSVGGYDTPLKHAAVPAASVAHVSVCLSGAQRPAGAENAPAGVCESKLGSPGCSERRESCKPSSGSVTSVPRLRPGAEKDYGQPHGPRYRGKTCESKASPTLQGNDPREFAVRMPSYTWSASVSSPRWTEPRRTTW
jgi:hypothetical protein